MINNSLTWFIIIEDENKSANLSQNNTSLHLQLRSKEKIAKSDIDMDEECFGLELLDREVDGHLKFMGLDTKNEMKIF